MSNVITMGYGDEFDYHQSAKYPMGQLGETPDGRKFRYVEVGATALVAGSLYQSEVPDAAHDDLVVPAAVALNSTTFGVTLAATEVTANEYADGYVTATDDAGEGYIYRLSSSHAAASASATATFSLVDGHAIQVAWTTSTTASLIPSPWRRVIIHPSPATAPPVGVAVNVCPAGDFTWIQTGGPAAVLTEGTLVITEPVRASETTNGAVTTVDWDETNINEIPVGWCMEVGPTTEHSIVHLTLD